MIAVGRQLGELMAKGQGTRRQKDIARMMKERRGNQQYKMKAWGKEVRGKEVGGK